MCKKISLLFILSLFSLSQWAQGSIRGVIRDAEFNDVLPFANVVVKSTDKGVTSDLDGAYEIAITPGTYTLIFSFVGYQNVEITGVVVTDNAVTEINTTLFPESNQLKEVVLTASTAKNTEASVITFQKNAVVVMNGISSEGLKKTGASNLAAAVKSVPGVSVQGGKYVFVRGLGDRYTKSILNGIDIPGLDPDRNALQLDLFPSSIVDNIQVIKTATADLDADFTGGIVNIITKDFPVTKTMNWSVGTGVNPSMHFKDNFLQYKSSPTDILGFDSGQRDLPISRNTYIPFPYEQNQALNDITSSFDSELKAKNATSTPDLSLGYSYGNQKKVGSNKLGFLFAVGYKKYTDFYQDYSRGNFAKSSDTDVFELVKRNTQLSNNGINGVLLNGLAGINFKTDKSKYSLNLMHIQNGESQAAKNYKEERFTNTIDIAADYLDYTQRSITNAQLTGKHTSESGQWVNEWMVSPTLSKIQDKDIRYTPFEITNNGYIFTQDAGGGRRLWRTLNEVNVGSKWDVSKKFTFLNRDAKLKFGAKFTYKQRDYSIDQYAIVTYATDAGYLNGNADALLHPTNLWVPSASQENQATYIKGNYEKANTYDAYNTNLAGYISQEFYVTEKLKSIVGFRTEVFNQYYTGETNNGDVKYFNEKTIEDLGLFPSLNLIYKVNDRNNLRVSYYKATARPSFKEASISQIYDPLSNLTYNGNLSLKPSVIQNMDLRYEFFINTNEMLSFSGFYKTFKDPIELAFYSASAPGNTQHRNIGNAQVYGAEIEMKKSLNFMGDALKNFDINVNASYIFSQQEMDKSPNGEYESKLANLRTGEKMKDTRPLQGQSPYLVNTVLSYGSEANSWKSNIAYNVQGETLEVVGIGAIPDVYTQPFHSINFNLSKSFGKEQKTNITLQVNNILNQNKTSEFQSYKAVNQIFSQKKEGVSFGLSFEYKL